METGAVLNDYSGSLRGISNPDALLCCINADASVPHHKRAGVGSGP